MKNEIFVTKSSMPPIEEYIEKIRPLWATRWLTNMGMLHNELEDELKKYLSVKELSLMVNGHMALEFAISAMRLPEGGEVITTPFTFISTTHAIVRNGLSPVFCDVKKDDFTIDEEKIEHLITDKTVAIVPVHVYGNICAIEKIQAIADKYNLKVIYDAAHAFGVKYKGVGVGNFGNASTFSFHATKVFHTIEGGAVTFQNPELNKILYNLKNFGIRSEEVVAEVGANAKMNEFCAAMGLCNLKYVDQQIAQRKVAVQKYRELLESVEGIRYLHYGKDIIPNYAYFPIVIDETIFGKTRNQVYDTLKVHGIHARKYFYPLTSDQACFRNRYKNVPLETARYLTDRVLTLPLYSELSMAEIQRIVDVLLHG